VRGRRHGRRWPLRSGALTFESVLNARRMPLRRDSFDFLFPRVTGMRRAIVQCVVMCFLAWMNFSFAQQQESAEAVPIEKEPRHKLVLENAFLRVFDTQIPAGDVSLYHTHLEDSVFISIQEADTQSEEPDKPIPKRPPFKVGDVWYRAHSKTPLTHRVHNIGQTDSRVIDIEIISPVQEAQLPTLPAVYKPVLDNDRVRVSRLVLQPGQSTGFIEFTRPGMLVVVKPSRLTIDRKPNHTLFDPDPGDFNVREKPNEQRVVNSGNTPFEAIEIEVK